MQVKELLNSGGITSVQEAVDKVGVSRSAYYKYKDHVFTLGESTRGRTAIISINLADEAGILSNVLNAISASGANVLTINQTIPINNVANVTISIETGELVIGLTKLLNKIAKMQRCYVLEDYCEGVNLMANIAVLGYGTVAQV